MKKKLRGFGTQLFLLSHFWQNMGGGAIPPPLPPPVPTAMRVVCGTTLEEMLSTFVAPHQKNWGEYLPYLTMAYRASVHESTKYSKVMRTLF